MASMITFYWYHTQVILIQIGGFSNCFRTTPFFLSTHLLEEELVRRYNKSVKKIARAFEILRLFVTVLLFNFNSMADTLKMIMYFTSRYFTGTLAGDPGSRHVFSGTCILFAIPSLQEVKRFEGAERRFHSSPRPL